MPSSLCGRARFEQEGSSPTGDLWRWTFSVFSDDRVRWQGFLSKDEGHSWLRGEEIILTRHK